MSRLSCASVRRPTADLMLLATVSLWALNFTVSKYILDHGFRPLAYSSIRYACAALLFAAITLALEGSLRMGTPRPADHRLLHRRRCSRTS